MKRSINMTFGRRVYNQVAPFNELAAQLVIADITHDQLDSVAADEIHYVSKVCRISHLVQYDDFAVRKRGANMVADVGPDESRSAGKQNLTHSSISVPGTCCIQ